MAGVSCIGAESLRRLWGREDPSVKEGAEVSGSQGGFNMPGRGAGLLANAESSSAIFWCRSLSDPGVGRRLVECCFGLPMKSLRNRCRRMFTASDRGGFLVLMAYFAAREG